LNFQDPVAYKDLETLELHDSLVGVLVTCKFSLTTIFIIGLAKWFSRVQLSLIFVT